MRSIVAPVLFLVASAAFAPSFAQSRGPADPNARLDRLEQQLSDLQGVVAAVETLAKSNGGGFAAAGGGANADQVRQLTEQLAELNRRLQRLEARYGSNTAAPGEPSREQTGYNTVPPASGFEEKEQLPQLGEPPREPDRFATRPSDGGQQTASSPSQSRPYGMDGSATASPTPRPTSAPIDPAASTPKGLLDQGYGAIGRRDYSAAESYFQQFLDQYPNDLAAGSAQYGSGEAAFQSGEYRAAADRFLKTFTNYPRNDKAPEALLKLAISLRRLGENAAACDSFAELQRRYPQSPKGVLQRADAEKKRANCG